MPLYRYISILSPLWNPPHSASVHTENPIPQKEVKLTGTAFAVPAAEGGILQICHPRSGALRAP
jgi:hypothetical protein